jgi:hypothetical protein
MKVFSVSFTEDGLCEIVYQEDNEKAKFGEVMRALRFDCDEFGSETEEFFQDVQSYVDAVVSKLHDDV